MAISQALRDFRSSLGLAEVLMSRERRFSDPPQPQNLRIVQALRGGAAVLMVAAFENFLKEVVEERLSELTVYPLRFRANRIPFEMEYHNVRQTLELASRGPFIGNPSRADKIILARNASQIVVQGTINPASFTNVTRSNPNSRRLRELFKGLGINDIFASIKTTFDARWGAITAHTFIQDTLDSILARRHEVAHTALVLNVSRHDLQSSTRFLRILASLCDDELRKQIRTILR